MKCINPSQLNISTYIITSHQVFFFHFVWSYKNIPSCRLLLKYLQRHEQGQAKPRSLDSIKVFHPHGTCCLPGCITNKSRVRRKASTQIQALQYRMPNSNNCTAYVSSKVLNCLLKINNQTKEVRGYNSALLQQNQSLPRQWCQWIPNRSLIT